VEKKEQKSHFLINNFCYEWRWGSEFWKNRVHEKLQTNFGTKMLFSLHLLKIPTKYLILDEK
jgi:hypothetical protein